MYFWLSSHHSIASNILKNDHCPLFSLHWSLLIFKLKAFIRFDVLYSMFLSLQCDRHHCPKLITHVTFLVICLLNEPYKKKCGRVLYKLVGKFPCHLYIPTLSALYYTNYVGLYGLASFSNQVPALRPICTTCQFNFPRTESIQ